MAWRLLIGRRGKPMRCSLPMAQLLANLGPILLPPPALLILLSSPNWPSVPPPLPLQNNSDLIWLLSFRLAKATPEKLETRQAGDLIKSQRAVVATVAAAGSQLTGADYRHGWTGSTGVGRWSSCTGHCGSANTFPPGMETYSIWTGSSLK